MQPPPVVAEHVRRNFAPESARLILANPEAVEHFARRLRLPRSKCSPPRTKATIPTALRWEVWERDNFTCQECGIRRRLSVDHVLPESLGGTLDLDNLRTLCVPCNSRKGARVPA